MCYRAHCVATTKALVPELGLAGDSYRISFQSRLGRDPWLAPNSSEVFAELARAGKRNVAVLCPAFVADCLETLEEIAIRENEAFRAAGGECLRLITSLNSEDIWAQAVAQIATEFVGVPVLASR